MKKLILLAIVIISCNTQKIQIRKLDQLAIEQPAEMARLSNWLYPCFSGKAKADTVIKLGMPDTVITYLHRDAGGGQIAKPDTVVKTVTISLPYFVTVTDTVPDTRGLAAANAACKQEREARIISDTKLIIQQKETSKWRLWCLITWGIIAAIVVYRVVKLIYGGGFVSAATNALKKL